MLVGEINNSDQLAIYKPGQNVTVVTVRHDQIVILIEGKVHRCDR